MALSIRSQFILISVSITVLALLLFSSVMYDRAIKYKHAQEINSYRALAEQFYNTVLDVNDLSFIKQTLSNGISSKFQPAKFFLILNKGHEVIFKYSNDDSKEKLLTKIYPYLKENSTKNEGDIEEEGFHYFWLNKELRGYTEKEYSLLVIYPLSSSVASEVLKFFGLPFYISGFLLIWVMVWASIILSSLVTKLQCQKEILAVQAEDIEKKRDAALSANVAKSNFLANMSHEIRTPLTSIIGFAESCLDIEQSVYERISATKTIIKNGKHLMHIINEVLDLSKVEAGKIEIEKIPVSVTEILDEINQIILIMAEEKGLNFGINYTYPIPDKVISDPLRIKQIIINLCTNAIKFTAKGHVYVNVSYIPASTNLIFEVVDTGIGMSAEQKEKIFIPFVQADSSTTRKFGGTGLGLTLSRQLVEMLNGDLTVESIIDKGSSFTVKIKIDEVDNMNYIHESSYKSISAVSERHEVVVPNLQGRVLVAEDNIDIQSLVKLFMKKAGIDVDIVDNGEQAINKATKIEYDLIFMDIQMPVMDGLTAMHNLIQQGYSKPVIAMTANAMKEDREKCKEAGFSGFVSKPINRNDVYLALMQHLKPGKTLKRDKPLLTSDLLKDDPDLIDLIDKFMARLPVMRDAIFLAHKENKEEELSGLIHQLKGVGGGYGYPMLTELCAKIEFQIASQHAENVNALMEEFGLLVEEILKGSDENHKIADHAQP